MDDMDSILSQPINSMESFLPKLSRTNSGTDLTQFDQFEFGVKDGGLGFGGSMNDMAFGLGGEMGSNTGMNNMMIQDTLDGGLDLGLDKGETGSNDPMGSIMTMAGLDDQPHSQQFINPSQALGFGSMDMLQMGNDGNGDGNVPHGPNGPHSHPPSQVGNGGPGNFANPEGQMRGQMHMGSHMAPYQMDTGQMDTHLMNHQMGPNMDGQMGQMNQMGQMGPINGTGGPINGHQVLSGQIHGDMSMGGHQMPGSMPLPGGQPMGGPQLGPQLGPMGSMAPQSANGQWGMRSGPESHPQWQQMPPSSQNPPTQPQQHPPPQRVPAQKRQTGAPASRAKKPRVTKPKKGAVPQTPTMANDSLPQDVKLLQKPAVQSQIPPVKPQRAGTQPLTRSSTSPMTPTIPKGVPPSSGGAAQTPQIANPTNTVPQRVQRPPSAAQLRKPGGMGQPRPASRTGRAKTEPKASMPGPPTPTSVTGQDGPQQPPKASPSMPTAPETRLPANPDNIMQRPFEFNAQQLPSRIPAMIRLRMQLILSLNQELIRLCMSAPPGTEVYSDALPRIKSNIQYLREARCCENVSALLMIPPPVLQASVRLPSLVVPYKHLEELFR